MIIDPATVIVPERGLTELFAVKEKATLPLPVPGDPDVIVIHETLLTAVQPHPLEVVKTIEPVPEPAIRLVDDGVAEYVQPAPCWVTVNC